MPNKSIMIVGVGGQGTLLASRIIGDVAVKQGYEVKVSEVHGMSQRGGSVVTYVRYGDNVCSPIVSHGGADIILAFEELEALRYICYLKGNGKMIINTQKIDPMPVIIGNQKYPDAVISKIQKIHPNITTVDALSLAKKSGTVKAVNVVLLGVMAKHTNIGKQQWIDSIKRTVPAKFVDVNLKAFELGYNVE